MAAPTAVLFLGTANAARSLVAECVLTRLGGDRFRAYSAGSRPAGSADPATLRFLDERGYATAGLRSKSWDEFAGAAALALDIVITLANSLIGEVCPVFWTGRPTSSHWPLPDKCDLAGAHDILERRVSALVELPISACDAMTLQSKLDAIGRH